MHYLFHWRDDKKDGIFHPQRAFAYGYCHSNLLLHLGGATGSSGSSRKQMLSGGGICHLFYHLANEIGSASATAESDRATAQLMAESSIESETIIPSDITQSMDTAASAATAQTPASSSSSTGEMISTNSAAAASGMTASPVLAASGHSSASTRPVRHDSLAIFFRHVSF